MIAFAMSLPSPFDPDADPVPAHPLDVAGEPVRPEWIDYNGHMNLAYYVLAFDHATDRFLDLLDLGHAYMQRSNHSSFVLETHVTYAQEVKLGDPMRFTLQLLDADEKRLHYYFEMFHGVDGYLAAASELISMHVDLGTRRSAPIPELALRRIAAIQTAHRDLPRPAQAGRLIGIRRPKTG
ncbi:MAG: thioesterase family protein [Alphaproteobacteria bacterium]|jgi:acyl-CoA thioester hydrolase|nr:thioesterase family protein [Alphaproteobacteria bacterium]